MSTILLVGGPPPSVDFDLRPSVLRKPSKIFLLGLGEPVVAGVAPSGKRSGAGRIPPELFLVPDNGLWWWRFSVGEFGQDAFPKGAPFEEKPTRSWAGPGTDLQRSVLPTLLLPAGSNTEEEGEVAGEVAESEEAVLMVRFLAGLRFESALFE